VLGGLLLTEEDLKLGCMGLSKTGKKRVIKVQIKARTELLKCKEHRKLVKSKATVEELQEFFLFKCPKAGQRKHAEVVDEAHI